MMMVSWRPLATVPGTSCGLLVGARLVVLPRGPAGVLMDGPAVTPLLVPLPGSVVLAVVDMKVTGLLFQCHSVSLKKRIFLILLFLLFSSLRFTGSAPTYISELLQLYSPSRSLRSSSDTSIRERRRFNSKTHGFRSFSYFGPHI